MEVAIALTIGGIPTNATRTRIITAAMVARLSHTINRAPMVEAPNVLRVLASNARAAAETIKRVRAPQAWRNTFKMICRVSPINA
jgi:hypothetical protein